MDSPDLLSINRIAGVKKSSPRSGGRGISTGSSAVLWCPHVSSPGSPCPEPRDPKGSPIDSSPPSLAGGRGERSGSSNPNGDRAGVVRGLGHDAHAPGQSPRWAILADMLPPLAPSTRRDSFRIILGSLGASWGAPGPLTASLKPRWAILGPSWGLLGFQWVQKGTSMVT